MEQVERKGSRLLIMNSVVFIVVSSWQVADNKRGATRLQSADYKIKIYRDFYLQWDTFYYLCKPKLV